MHRSKIGLFLKFVRHGKPWRGGIYLGARDLKNFTATFPVHFWYLSYTFPPLFHYYLATIRLLFRYFSPTFLLLFSYFSPTIFFFGKNGGASRCRVCYQYGRGLPRLVFLQFTNGHGWICLPPTVPHFLANAGTTKMRTSSFGLMLDPAKIVGHRVPMAVQSSSKVSSCKRWIIYSREVSLL